jgi:hypothetical protein
MKTDSELDRIVTEICHAVAHGDDSAGAIKLLCGIQIDALRHAKDMLDKSQTETPVSDLAGLIRELELK